MNKQTTIEELKNIAGVSDFKNITQADVEKILKLVGEKRLKEAHIKALVELTPKFLQLSAEALKTISTVAEAAKVTQKEALSTIRASVDGISAVLQILAKTAETDATREKISSTIIEAGKLYVEIAKIVKDMNQDNNTFWKQIAGIAAIALLAVLGAVAAGGKGNDSNQA